MIKKLDWSHDAILAYEASGQFSAQENSQVLTEVKETIEKHGKVRLLVKLPEIAYPEATSIKDRLNFAKEYKNSIERYALVSNITAMEWISTIAGMFTGIEFRSYSMDDEIKARAWLEAKHV